MTGRSLRLSRRQLIQGAAAVAGTAAFGPSHAAAQEKPKGTIVVGTWSGEYASLLHRHIEEAILIPQGWEIVQDQGGDPQRRKKMLAEQRLPRGTTDLQGLSAFHMYQMHAAGVVAEIDYARIPNARYLLESMKYPYGVGHIYSGKVAVYNPKVVDEPLTSYKDVLNPRWGDKLAVIDVQYQYTLVAAAIAAGGSISDLEPGKALLLECKKAGMRVYPTNEDFAQGLKGGEISVGIMWKASLVQWQEDEVPVQAITPSEGALAYVTGFVIPKNAPNEEGAYAYLNAMLEKPAQEAFAVEMGYNPTVMIAEVAPDLNKRIGFTEAERKKLINLDYAYMAENDNALKEWWEKVLKA